MIIVLDIETTGLDEYNDEIIELALVKIDKNYKYIDKINYLINPSIDIPEIVSNLTGITNKDVKNSPKIIDLKEKIKNFIGDFPILGHNIDFDIKFLKKYGLDFSNNILIDTLSLANFLFLDKTSLSLENLSLELNFDIKNHHRALDDVYTTIELFKYEISLIKNLTKSKKLILKYLFSKTSDKGIKYILNHYIDNNLDKIDKTLFTKILLKLFPIIKEKEDIKKIKTQKNIRDIIDNLDNIEVRQNQLIMLEKVEESLNNNKKIVIEAPTGVGKTFGYLIPAILYSITKGEQVFISTSTKALQDQIFNKDLEFLYKNIGFSFTFSKLKGKSNYISINSFFNFFENIEDFNRNKISFLLKIIFWLFETKTFELDELNFYPYEFGFLNDIDSNNLLTFSSKNPYFNREPVIIQRKKAKNFNIVIINNNILFQDLNSDFNILGGKIKNLIIDEAHNLEDVITNSLKKDINILDLEKRFNIIKSILIKNNLLVKDYLINIDKIFFDLELLFGELKNYLFFKISNLSNIKKCLLEGDFYNSIDINIDIKNIILSILSNLIILKDKLYLLPDYIFLDINRELTYLDNFIDIISILSNKENLEEKVIILKYSDKIGLIIEQTILNPGKYLSNNLWNKLNSCILTSATLQTNNSFDYIKNVLSLDSYFKEYYKLKSDFDYKKQALLYIPNDLGSVKDKNNNLIINFIKDFISIVRGNTLVLFTSFSMIKEVYSSIFLDLKDKDINIFVQGITGSKYKILNFFKKNSQNSIIFGTDTFWEGIDLSGDDLKYLIIHKIPFIVPDDPIFIARSKLFKDPFLEYAIPKAILKLKQGFGRLIRTKKDKGVIIFLDYRIFSTSWGEALLTAFPENIKYKIGISNRLLNVLKSNKK